MKKIPVFPILTVISLVIIAGSVTGDMVMHGNGISLILYADGVKIDDSNLDAAEILLLTCKEEPNSYSRTVPDWVQKEKYFDYGRNCYWEFGRYETIYSNPINFVYADYGGKYIRLLINHPNGLYKSETVLLAADAGSFGSNIRLEADLNHDGSISFRGEALKGGYAITEKNIFNFFGALILTLMLELIVAFIYIIKAKLSKEILKSVFVVNVISLIIVWILYYILNATMLAFILVELFAIVFEGVLIHKLDNDLISLKSSFVLSTLMNLASVILGNIIVDVLVPLFVAY